MFTTSSPFTSFFKQIAQQIHTIDCILSLIKPNCDNKKEIEELILIKTHCLQQIITNGDVILKEISTLTTINKGPNME